MRRLTRSLAPLVVIAALVAGGIAYTTAQGETARAYTARVVIVDNDAKLQGIDEGTAEWGFAPNSVVVTQGEPIVFDNPSTNHYPHTVTSITISGRFPNSTAEFGTKFNSSTNFQTAIAPGGSWTLDTTDLDPGHYSYYCWIHPWMTGEITVVPAAGS